MFRKTFTALLTVASLSFAGAAFAAEPAHRATPVTAPTKSKVKVVSTKKMKNSKTAAVTQPSTTATPAGAQQVDVAKPHAQPRTAKKGHRTAKKVQRVTSTKAITK
jgi:hypothetical protein